MPTLIHDNFKDSIVLGNHEVHFIQKIYGMEDLPPGIDGEKLLSLELPRIPIVAGGFEVGAREFYLCYSPQHSFLFVVETEMGKRVETRFRPQYGANSNYDTHTQQQRTVWIYAVDSPRAEDPVIAERLNAYLP